MPHMALTLVPSPTPIPQIITDTVSTSSRMSFHNINHSTIEAEHQQQQHNCKATVISSALEDHESTLHTSLCSHLLNCHPSPRSTTSSLQVSWCTSCLSSHTSFADLHCLQIPHPITCAHNLQHPHTMPCSSTQKVQYVRTLHALFY